MFLTISHLLQAVIMDTDGEMSPVREQTSTPKEEVDNSRYPGFWTDEGQYLSETVADILIKAVADVNQHRPENPIGHLAVALYTLRFIPQNFSEPPKNGFEAASSPDSGISNDSTIAKKTAFQDKDFKIPDYNRVVEGKYNNLNHITRDGANILHYAASIPHEKGVLYRLISHAAKNAKLSQRDKIFLTPRDVALESMLERNVEEIDKWVFNHVAEGNIDVLKDLLLDGYEYITELEAPNGMNVIDVAASKQQKAMVEFLKLAATFEERREFLHKVIKVGSLPHVEFMADSDDIVRAKDNRGRTSLHLATLCEEGPIMLLLANKFPFLLSVGDNLRRTPLHYAMAVENVDEIAKILVQAGAKRTTKDLREKLPSYYFMNREEIVQMIKEIYREEVENDFT